MKLPLFLLGVALAAMGGAANVPADDGDAAALVREVNPPRLKTLLLAHISRHCNAPYLALEAMRPVVAELGRPITLDVLDQDTPSPLYEF